MLKVLVRDRAGVKYEGQAQAVSSINASGPFDILPSHSNFISLIRKRVTIIAANKQKTEFNADSGVVQVLGNQVRVYLSLTDVEATGAS